MSKVTRTILHYLLVKMKCKCMSIYNIYGWMLNDSCFISQLRNTPQLVQELCNAWKRRGERRLEVIFLFELIPSFIQGPKHTSRNHALLGGSIGWKLIIKQSASPSYIE